MEGLAHLFLLQLRKKKKQREVVTSKYDSHLAILDEILKTGHHLVIQQIQTGDLLGARLGTGTRVEI